MGGTTLRLNRTCTAGCVSICAHQRDCREGKEGEAYHDVRREFRGAIRGREVGKSGLVVSEERADAEMDGRVMETGRARGRSAEGRRPALRAVVVVVVG